MGIVNIGLTRCYSWWKSYKRNIEMFFVLSRDVANEQIDRGFVLWKSRSRDFKNLSKFNWQLVKNSLKSNKANNNINRYLLAIDLLIDNYYFSILEFIPTITCYTHTHTHKRFHFFITTLSHRYKKLYHSLMMCIFSNYVRNKRDILSSLYVLHEFFIPNISQQDPRQDLPRVWHVTREKKPSPRPLVGIKKTIWQKEDYSTLKDHWRFLR